MGAAENQGAPAPRRRVTRAVLRTGIVVVALTGLGVLSLLWTVAGHINRVDGAFAGLEESERPLPATQLV